MAYSKDLRTCVVRHFLQNEVQYREVAALFQIGAATVHRWVEQFNRAGTVSRTKSTGRPPLVAPSGHEKLKEFVLSNSDKSLAVLSDKWQEKFGQKLSISTLGRTIARTGLTYKKNSARNRT